MEGKLATDLSHPVRFHTLARYLMTHSLRRTLPGHLWVRRDTAVTVDEGTAAEPDIVVVDAETDDVVLAVEVVPPGPEEPDRKAWPDAYAAAGIAHFWRVGQDPGTDRPMVHVHEWDAEAGAYTLTGVHRDELTVLVPYRITVDLTGIDHL
jgi:hypothetical protein